MTHAWRAEHLRTQQSLHHYVVVLVKACKTLGRERLGELFRSGFRGDWIADRWPVGRQSHCPFQYKDVRMKCVRRRAGLVFLALNCYDLCSWPLIQLVGVQGVVGWLRGEVRPLA